MPSLLSLAKEVKCNGQDYYISKYSDMSYAAFIFPENKEVILNEMEQAFKT